MTYNVLMGTLNPTYSLKCRPDDKCLAVWDPCRLEVSKTCLIRFFGQMS